MKNLFWGLSLAVTALLAACSSGSGTNSEPLENSSNSSSESFNEYDGEVELFDDLPRCTGKKDGEVYYVKEAGVAYTCRYDEDEEAGEWINASEGSDGSSSSDETDDDKSSASEGPKSSDSEGEEGSSASVPGGSSDASTYDVVTGTLTDSRDGQTYRTVKISGQVWMAQNLNYAYTGVPFDNGYYTSDSTSWCYDNDPANCAKYGRLYTWAVAMDSVGEWSTNGKGCGYGKTCSVASAGSATLVRGICPKGWHLPSHDEWKALIVAVDGSITEYTSSNTAGYKLKSTSGWEKYEGSSGNGGDVFGFSALPAGDMLSSGYYYYEGDDAYFWSSTEGGSNFAYYMGLCYKDVNANLDGGNKYYGFSVRCLKD
jgi:uncharacterized protein (TIGR02145 family)